MIRRFIIEALTLAAVGLGVALVASFVRHRARLPDMIRKIGLPKLRIAAALCAGLFVPLAGMIGQAASMRHGTTMSVAAPVSAIALAIACRPWTSFALALRLSLVASLGFIIVGSANMFWSIPDGIRLVPWYFPVGVLAGFVVAWAVSMVVLSSLVFIRMRYWPSTHVRSKIR